jgi:hypothetical protein
MRSELNTIEEIQVGPHLIKLSIHKDKPIAEFDEEHFSQLWFLVQSCPLLSDPKHLKEFARISNFFWKGVIFRYIDSISQFQQYYHDQIELERLCPGDIFPFRLTDYKIFDVSVMHEPHLEDGSLYYFVYNSSNGLPYRVVCPFPYTTTSTLVHYQILPIIEEAID